jgi:hypothetical protein
VYKNTLASRSRSKKNKSRGGACKGPPSPLRRRGRAGTTGGRRARRASAAGSSYVHPSVEEENRRKIQQRSIPPSSTTTAADQRPLVEVERRRRRAPAKRVGVGRPVRRPQTNPSVCDRPPRLQAFDVRGGLRRRRVLDVLALKIGHDNVERLAVNVVIAVRLQVLDGGEAAGLLDIQRCRTHAPLPPSAPQPPTKPMRQRPRVATDQSLWSLGGGCGRP